MIKYIPYLLYFLLIGLHQVMLKDLTQIYTASINLPIIIVLILTLYKSELTVVWFAFLAGVVVAVAEPGLMGWQGLVYATLAILSYNICQKLNLESIFSRVLVVAFGVFISNILTLLLYRTDGFWILLGTNAILGAIYSMLIVWLFFLIKDGKITYKRFKTIF